MKRALKYTGLLGCLAVALLLLLTGVRKSAPVSIASLGWRTGVSSAAINPYASIEVTNRTAQAMVVGLAVQALNRQGVWEPIPERLVFEPEVAGRMIVVPPGASTNLTLKWVPGRGSTWRVQGFYQKVLGQQEGAVLRLMWRFGLKYPFVKEGETAAQEIGTPTPR